MQLAQPWAKPGPRVPSRIQLAVHVLRKGAVAARQPPGQRAGGASTVAWGGGRRFEAGDL